MFKNLSIGIAAASLIGGALPETAPAQEASITQESVREQERKRGEAERRESERERAELEAARARLEEARRELEEAAREVGELSRRDAGYVYSYNMGMRGAMRAELGITLDDSDEGVRVTGVTPGGPAAAAGVAVGDVITAIDSTTLAGAGSESQRLVEHMRNVDPGQAVVLHIERDGAAREITVTAREPDHNVMIWGAGDNELFVRGPGSPGGITMVTPGTAPRLVGPGGAYSVFLGGRWNDLEVVTLTPELGSYFGATEGLLVVRAPDEPRIGLQDGDVILDIAGRQPTSPEHAMRILMSFEPGETLRFSIMRRQRRENVEYTVPDR
jgi:C-terminal processing protease CtpA/Prc